MLQKGIRGYYVPTKTSSNVGRGRRLFNFWGDFIYREKIFKKYLTIKYLNIKTRRIKSIME